MIYRCPERKNCLEYQTNLCPSSIPIIGEIGAYKHCPVYQQRRKQEKKRGAKVTLRDVLNFNARNGID